MLAALLALWSAAAAAPGEIDADVVCAADPSKRYALYLPSDWTPDRAWPLLVVLDARGRALHAIERFVPAAEQYGWVVASSYDSASDTVELNPTPDAVHVIMWPDASVLWGQSIVPS